ncbi:MAG: hypothetical protein WC289_03200 [Patescibacteria group bacterium]|jgi:hypothetical protein
MYTWELILGACAGIVGYALVSYTSGKKEGARGRIPSLRIPVGDYYVHIHHWMWSLAIVAVLILVQFWHPIVYGFLLGIMLQGFSYKDFYKIFY